MNANTHQYGYRGEDNSINSRLRHKRSAMRISWSIAIFTFAFTIVLNLAAGQEPCITEPMKGYSGKCEITVTISPDGKYLYTSDRVSLKVWSITDSTVVDEIAPFPYDLLYQSNDPGLLNVMMIGSADAVTNIYDLKKRTIVPEPSGSMVSLEKAMMTTQYSSSWNNNQLRSCLPSTSGNR